MCGIAGIIESRGKSPDQDSLVKMSDQIALRGPDHLGIKVYDQVGFVHRRLSIIDLSENANQPFELVIDGNTFSMVFNGEIYNFKSLKSDLEKEGITFNTSSDTEVILKAYIHQGTSFISKLRGMFAFAINDPLKRKVVMARDHFGKKPFYYTHHNGHFIFCSEIKGISSLCSGLQVDYNALNYYLTELSVPQPLTIWKEVKQLEPGTILTLYMDDLNYELQRYHHFDQIEKLDISFEDSMDLIEKELQIAIDRRKISDVPIGYFLSGGVDSGLIVAMAAQREKISTYSVGYENSAISELDDAKKVAERYDTDHHEIIIKPDIENDLEDIVNYFGEPFADASAIPSYYISTEMRKNVKVAISGDGGDENFGYKSYSFFHEVDAFVDGRSESAIKKKILSSKIKSRIGLGENYGQYAETIFRKRKGSIYKRGMAFEVDELPRLWSQSEANAHVSYVDNYLDEIWKNATGTLLTDRVITGSFRTRLLNDYLVKVDRMSMANSLEVRSPFLDVDFASKVLTIPNDYKLKDGTPKYILKKLAEKWVANDILTRKKKGFSIPVNDWLKNDLKSKVDHYLDEVLAKSEWFSKDFLKETKAEFFNTPNVQNYKIWTLICLAIWFEKEM